MEHAYPRIAQHMVQTLFLTAYGMLSMRGDYYIPDGLQNVRVKVVMSYSV